MPLYGLRGRFIWADAMTSSSTRSSEQRAASGVSASESKVLSPRLVDRVEGLAIALTAKQLDMKNKCGNKKELFSEDVYNDPDYIQD